MRIRNIIAAAAAVALLGTALPAQAQDVGFYLTPKLTYNFKHYTNASAKAYQRNHGLESQWDRAFGLGLAAGYDMFTQFALPVRVDMEAMHVAKSKHDGTTQNLFGNNFNYKQETNVTAIFVNGYFDLHNNTIFTPYAGGGLGGAWARSEGSVAGWSAPQNTERNFAWNVGAGMAVELDYNTSLDFGYRYASFGTTKSGLTGAGNYLESDLGMHQLSVGLRYTF